MLNRGKVILGVLLVSVVTLTSNYFFPIDNTYQADSENLALGSVTYAGQEKDLPQYGLFKVSFDEAGETLEMTAYESQIGLQGYAYMLISRFLSKLVNRKVIYYIFRVTCAGILSVILSCIVVLISKKYTMSLALSFYITFFLSPWIRCFGANLYWVAFTWFMPMLLGLILSIDYQKYDRWWMYALITSSIILKCACGYEYISTIMMGQIMFALTDLIICEKCNRKYMFSVVLKIGLSALIGVVIVLGIHSLIRGDGNVVLGFKSIWRTDILRRTLGGNPIDFDDIYRESLEASVFETIAKYFDFGGTQVIEGVAPFLFVPLVLAAICIYIVRIHLGRNEKFELPLFIITFASTLSWFVLAKSHSYIHTHLNFVLWYFGFVQMCIYSIIATMINLIMKCKDAIEVEKFKR